MCSLPPVLPILIQKIEMIFLISKMSENTRVWASPVVQRVKNQPAVQETWVRSLGWNDLLEKGKATHPSILAWRIPMDRGAWWATVHGLTESDMTERLRTHVKYM